MWMAQTFARPMPLGSWMEVPRVVPADSLALVAGTGSFVLTVGGSVSLSGIELSVDNAVVQSVSLSEKSCPFWVWNKAVC